VRRARVRESVRELIVLLRKGRLTLPNDVAAWVAKTMKDLELTEAPFTVEVALAITSIKFPHDAPPITFLQLPQECLT
jgi:PIN domain nuclease of toxin-antitoxin system